MIAVCMVWATMLRLGEDRCLRLGLGLGLDRVRVRVRVRVKVECYLTWGG